MWTTYTKVECDSRNGRKPQGRMWGLVTKFPFIYPNVTLLCESSCLLGTSKVGSVTYESETLTRKSTDDFFPAAVLIEL